MADALDTVEDVIRARRTSLRVDLDRPVPDELVDRLLELAVWAPNHKRTFPWRFAVVTGAARARFGAVVAAYEQAHGGDERRVAKARTKYERAPVVVLVGSVRQTDPVRRVEDRDAVAAGVQNLLLGATAAGLASHWATGTWMDDPDVKAFAGLAPDEELVALVYLGWPSGAVEVVGRPSRWCCGSTLRSQGRRSPGPRRRVRRSRRRGVRQRLGRRFAQRLAHPVEHGLGQVAVDQPGAFEALELLERQLRRRRG